MFICRYKVSFICYADDLSKHDQTISFTVSCLNEILQKRTLCVVNLISIVLMPPLVPFCVTRGVICWREVLGVPPGGGAE